MKKFTKLWQLMMILLLTSSVAFAQVQKKSVNAEKIPEKQIQKKLSSDQIKTLKDAGLQEDEGLIQESNYESLKEFSNETAPVMQEGLYQQGFGEQEEQQEAAYYSKQKLPVASSIKKVEATYSPAPTDAVLWSQMTAGDFSGASQDFESAYDIYDCIGGDDFTVTGGPWDILVIRFMGTWSVAGPADGFNIEFYNDNAGVPGTSVMAFPSVPYSEAGGLFTCILPSVLNLADGNYWISIQARLDFSSGGQWYWTTHEPPQIDYEAQWMNPGDGFGNGFTTWSGIHSLVWPGYDACDFSFELLDAIPPIGIAPQQWCQAYDGTLDAGESVIFEMNLLASETYNFSVCDQDACCSGMFTGDGDFYMYDNTMTQLWYIDGVYACGYDASTYGTTYEDWSPPSDGTYFLEVTDYYAGAADFTLAYIRGGAIPLTVQNVCNVELGTIPAGEIITYVIDMSTINTYNFSLCDLDATCPGDYHIAPVPPDTTGTDGDLYLFNNLGQLEWYIDGESACNWNASTWGTAYQDFAPATDACHFLLVTDWGGGYADFELGHIFASCPPPTTLFTDNITATSAKANWSDANHSLNYNVQWGLPGFTPDVDPIGSGNVTFAHSQDPYDFLMDYGLSAATNYEWYVQSDCGTDAVSIWAGPAAFNTSCPSSFPVPFVESFDVNTTPVCWLNYATSGGPWVFGQLGSAGYAAGAAPDHTGNGGYYAWIDFSGTDEGVVLEAPDVDVSTLTVPLLEFYFFSHNTNTGDLNILHVEAWDGAAWASVAILQEDNGGWTAYAYDLTAFTYGANLVKIRFRGESCGASGDYYNDLLIDDISIDEAPTCPNPTGLGVANLTDVSVDLLWTSNSGLSNIEWGYKGFTLGVDPLGTPTGVTSPHPVSGLSVATEYDFYVQDDCGLGDLSDWVGPYTFGTLSDLLYQINVEAIASDNRCLGAEFFNGSLWVTGSNTTLGNSIYEMDPYTHTLLNTYPQGTTSTWGMRDMADDGTYLYAGDDNGFYQIDPATGVVTTLFTPTGMGTIRALAYDGTYFWTKSFGGDIYQFDAAGNIINQYVQPYSTYGAAYDPTVPCIWLHASSTITSEPTEFVQILMDGTATGVAVGLPDHPCPTGGIVGGAFMDFGVMYPGKDVFGGLTQGTPDVVHIMEAYDTGFPNQSSNYNPACGENDVPISGTLTWIFGANTSTYDLWFGPAGSMVLVDGGTAGPSGSYAYSGLGIYTNYEWQVIEYNATGATDGLIYNFTTGCYITCPVGSTDEGEPCGDDVNGGCNMATPAFGPISDGETICGNTWDDGSNRDTDWYELVLTDPYNRVTIIGESEIDMIMGWIEQIVPGVPGCANITGYIDPYIIISPCDTDTVIVDLGAGTYYFFAAQDNWYGNICPGSVYWFSVDVEVIAPPTAVIDPMSFSVTLPVDGTASDDLNIGNTGDVDLTYDAEVVYPGGGTVTCYPVSANRWTGTTDGTTITDVSEVRGYDVEDGWFMFDISAIPAGKTITNIDFSGYVNFTNWPYWSVTPLTSDPLTATPADLYFDINDEANSAASCYLYQDEGSAFATGWHTYTLGGTANADLGAALTQGWFAMGMASRDNSTSYYINWDGWNETNVPYIVVSYSSGASAWLTLDGGATTSGSVPSGTTNVVDVGFDATGFAVGVYTASIDIETNEPSKVQNYSLPVTLTVVAAGYTVSGTLTYANAASTPMDFVDIKLMSGTTEYGSAVTDLNGDFAFSVPVADGNYTYMTTTTKTWGGLNMLDVIHTRQYLSGIIVFDALQQKAADVTHGTTTPNMLDVIVMRQRLSGPVPPLWGAPDYVYHDVAVTVAGANVIHDYESLCSGDPNGSYTPPGPTIVFFDDFDTYTAGTQLTVQNSTDWTTWSGTPGSAEDPFVSTTQAYSGVNSVNIVSGNDLVKPMPNYTSGKYRMSFRMFIPTGFDGYFNTLQEFTPAVFWGMQVYFPSGLNGSIDADGAAAATFTYSNDAWMYNEVFVDLDSDWAEYYLDGVLIHGWKWSEGAFGGNALNQLGGNNFFGHDQETTCNYYIDDYELLEQ